MIKHDVLDEVLNDSEKLGLQMFADNTDQFNAVKKVLLFDVYYNGILAKGFDPQPARNFALDMVNQYGAKLTDEEIGRDLRASAAAVRVVELAFNEITKFKNRTDDTPKNENKNNPR